VSSANPAIGPFGTPFAGGDGDACTGSPPIQPPDIAADVSPAENVELLNEGLWVFDKQGNLSVQSSLNSFWCPAGSTNPLPGCGTNSLTDTQIAFDQIAQRWLATTLSETSNQTTGNLYFAASNTSSAAGTWTLYAYANVCSFPGGTLSTYPDQPTLGYNGNWVVIDVLCGVFGGSFGKDNILTITHGSISGSTLPTSLAWGIQQSNYGAQRPSRDIGATSASDSYPDVLLVSSQVPSGSSLPYVVVQQIAPSTSNPPPITGPGPSGATIQSPGQGVAGNYGLTPAAQPGCAPSSNCAVILGDARIDNVALQKGNDGNHYLMTSFMAEDQADQTAQALWFLGKAETFASQTSQWNTWYVGGWSNAWGTYPTVIMDPDLDVAFTFETFGPNTNSYPNWYVAKGFVPPGLSYQSPPLLGYGILYSAVSSGAFMGQTSCPGSGNPAPRWGDYVSTLWDPNFSSPNESDAFWTVQEFTTGGSNQSTQWAALADPLPYFVGSSQDESECSGGGGSTCKVTIADPPGVQAGDVIIVGLALGEPAKALPVLPDSSWILLSASNINGSPQEIASNCGSGCQISSWLAAHIYTSNDSGSYTFEHYLNGNAEMSAILVAYRGAGQTLSNYTGYGFTQNGLLSSFSTTAISPSADGELATLVLADGGCESPEGSEATSHVVTAPTGMPTLAPETSLTDLPGFWIDADAGIPASGNSYGPYTITESPAGSCKDVGAYWLAWQAVIPE